MDIQVVDLETKQISDIQVFVNELVAQDNAVVGKQTRFGITTKLDSYYQAALRSHSYSQSFSIAEVNLMPGLGGRLLQELEYRIFADIQEMSTNADFLQVVIMALTQIIPGGYINKQFVRDFMAFVVSEYATIFCGYALNL